MRRPHLRRPRLLEDRVSDDAYLLDLHQPCGAGHDHRRGVSRGCDLSVDLQRHPLTRGVVHDVVVVGQAEEDLPVSDRVQHDHRPEAATGFVVQPAFVMLGQPSPRVSVRRIVPSTLGATITHLDIHHRRETRVIARPALH